MEEVWKEFKTFNRGAIVTDIEVSNFGNVRGKTFNFKPFTQNNIVIIDGRRCINNHHNKIYRIVDYLFRGPLPKGYCVHHIDHNKLNDRLDNLERMSRSYHQKIHTLNNNINAETKHINNGIEEKLVKISKLNQYLTKGWNLGRLKETVEKINKTKKYGRRS